jgi:thioredoxin-like negative regulator of GroEL
MNSIPSIPEITASSFKGHVLRSERPVLVLFCTDGDAAGLRLLSWLGECTPQASSLLNIVRVAQVEARPLAARWGIPSVPSLALLHAGSVCDHFRGNFSRSELNEVLAQARTLGGNRPRTPAPQVSAKPKERTRARRKPAKTKRAHSARKQARNFSDARGSTYTVCKTITRRCPLPARASPGGR